MEISEICRISGPMVDDLCFIRSMHTEHNNHLEGLNMLQTCKIFPGRPAMGAWISYALGTENQNLPAYVVLRDPEGYQRRQAGSFGRTDTCRPLYQGVEFNMQRHAGASSESRAAAAARVAARRASIFWPN